MEEKLEEKQGVTYFREGRGEDRKTTDEQVHDLIVVNKLFIRKKWNVRFGEFPQTIKSDNVTIIGTKDSRGFSLGTDGEFYAEVIASPYYKGYIFSNGTEIVKDRKYYFKVEPLSWTIIRDEGSRLLIHCNNIIINKAYQSHYDKDTDGDIITDFNDAPPDTYASNYIYSEIRAWLLNKFLKVIEATPGFADSKIKLLPYVIHENSDASFADKAFLLSRKDVENYGVGYKPHMRSATDFAKANGTYVYGAMSGVKSRASGKGWWWLRTPCPSEGQDTVHAIDQNGVTNYAWIWVCGYGIVPALYLDVSDYNDFKI